MSIPRREQWDGHPVELGDAWTLRKGEKVSRCILVSHELGWGTAADDDGFAALSRLQACFPVSV
jgi:hypothetical protein